jgi:L-ascorbate 6-phosphate lactonase
MEQRRQERSNLMSGNLAQTIATREVSKDHLAIYWLCQAGFAFKSSTGSIVYIDPYLSDLVERVVGFKRMMTCPIAAEEVSADLIICTHEHPDHMDTDALPVLAANQRTHFAGPIECMNEFAKIGLPRERCHLLEEGKSLQLAGVRVHSVYADHGELAPDALGIVLDFDGIRVYHTGDTAYRPQDFQPAIHLRPQILLPCINGAFGNMNAEEAASLTQLAHPEVVIPTHFWMFVEQNGDPRRFLELCAAMASDTKTVLMKPGEEYLFQRSK